MIIFIIAFQLIFKMTLSICHINNDRGSQSVIVNQNMIRFIKLQFPRNGSKNKNNVRAIIHVFF